MAEDINEMWSEYWIRSLMLAEGVEKGNAKKIGLTPLP